MNENKTRCFTSEEFIENINKLNDNIYSLFSQIKLGISFESYKNIIAQLRHDTFSLIFYGFDCCTLSYFEYEYLIIEYTEVFKLLFNLMFNRDFNSNDRNFNCNISVNLMFIRTYIIEILGKKENKNENN